MESKTLVQPGQQFGSWTVLSVGLKVDRKPCCLVRCYCGLERVKRRYDLLAGKGLSCGCARTLTREESFNIHVEKNPDGCWGWNGSSTMDGYSVIRAGGARYAAHRYSYETHKGPIPEGFVIDHLCRNPPCTNPDHLEAVTRAENTRRGHHAGRKGRKPGEKGRKPSGPRKTHCPKGHPYAGDNLLVRRCGIACRICKNDVNREVTRRRRAQLKAAQMADAAADSV